MAFNPRDLSVLAYTNGFTLWHYRSQDKAAQVRTPHYFDSAHEMLRIGDVILASVGPEEAPDALILLVSQVNKRTTVVRDMICTRPAGAFPDGYRNAEDAHAALKRAGRAE